MNSFNFAPYPHTKVTSFRNLTPSVYKLTSGSVSHYVYLIAIVLRDEFVCYSYDFKKNIIYYHDKFEPGGKGIIPPKYSANQLLEFKGIAGPNIDSLEEVTLPPELHTRVSQFCIQQQGNCIFTGDDIEVEQ